MTQINFTTTSGGKFSLRVGSNSQVFGAAITAQGNILRGEVFRPASIADRDALVNALNSLEYALPTYQLILEYTEPELGIYSVQIERKMAPSATVAWIAAERDRIAAHLGIVNKNRIRTTLKEI